MRELGYNWREGLKTLPACTSILCKENPFRDAWEINPRGRRTEKLSKVLRVSRHPVNWSWKWVYILDAWDLEWVSEQCGNKENLKSEWNSQLARFDLNEEQAKTKKENKNLGESSPNTNQHLDPNSAQFFHFSSVLASLSLSLSLFTILFIYKI